jgi:2-polyprenyl-3-methyl-5-hydroxy-6-metoxy-1,4-benzoquinol methylase
MDEQRYAARERARALAKESLARGDALGWFEEVYREAGGAISRVPWADREGHPLLRAWLAEHGSSLRGARALVVGCGLGEDAEELARAGAQVSAFDVAPTAIAWCARLWPNTSVAYSTADLLAPPASWRAAFDFVLEIYTLQALPAQVREQAARNMAQCVNAGGRLLAISRAREASEPLGELPWPLVRGEIERFGQFGLHERELEDLASVGDPPPPPRGGRVHRA